MRVQFNRWCIPLMLLFLLPLASRASNFEIRIFDGDGALLKTVGIESITSINWETQCYQLDSLIELPKLKHFHGHMEIVFNQSVMLKIALFDMLQSDLPPKKMPVTHTSHGMFLHKKFCFAEPPSNKALKRFRKNVEVLSFLTALNKIS